jgi:hypothetical protein
MIRADYRETLTSHGISGIDVDPGTTLTVVGRVLDGASRQDHVTMGMSFTF